MNWKGGHFTERQVCIETSIPEFDRINCLELSSLVTLLGENFCPSCVSDDIANPLHYRREVHDTSRYSTIEVVTPGVRISMQKFEQTRRIGPKRLNRTKKDGIGKSVRIRTLETIFMFQSACERFKTGYWILTRSKSRSESFLEMLFYSHYQ